jgi:hypothetical protein
MKPAVAVAALIVALTPLAAGAQTLSDAATAQPLSRGPMTVEHLQSGFLAAPDFKITDVDSKTSSLVGGYAGWVAKETIFIGGGGYWLANGSADRKMAYGGFIMQWMGFTSGPLGVGAKLLLGGGEATLASTVYAVNPPGPFPPNGPTPTPQTVTTARIRYNEGFWVTEPEANLFVKLGKNVRIAAGGSYRFAGTGYYNNYYYGDGSRLSGFTGSLGLQFGGGF